jgi:hypothetical protein
MDINQYGDVAIGQKATSTGGVARLFVGGNIQTTGAIIGSLSGGLSASNISADVFGRLQGNGNFAFPAGVNIGTSTIAGAPTEGLYVKGNVGIGTTTPSSKLYISGSYPQLILDNPTPGSGSYILFRNGGTNAGFIGHQNSVSKLQFSSTDSGVAHMTIDNSGKVGVGTTTPNALLEVASAGSGVDELRIGTNNAYEIKFVGTVATNIYSSGSGAPMYISTNNAPLYIGTTADGQNLSIVNNNVGIGTTGPGKLLEVSSNSSPAIRISNTAYSPANRFDISVVDSGGLYISDKDNHKILQLAQDSNGIAVGSGYATGAYTLPSNGMIIEGNVGIGTTTPGSKLDVAGTAQLRGAAGGTGLYVNSSGNVGIGTTSPSYVLDVKGPDTDNAYIARFYSTTGTRGSFGIRNGVGISPTTYIGTIGSSEQLDIGTENIGVIRIDANQNVGIGTTNPKEPLDVAGNIVINAVVPRFKLNATGQAADNKMWRSVVDGLILKNDVINDAQSSTQSWSEITRSGATITQVAFPNGNVGIGTTAPQNKLNVIGQINATTGFVVNSSTGMTGNWSVGDCWLGYKGGIMYATNCTSY